MPRRKGKGIKMWEWDITGVLSEIQPSGERTIILRVYDWFRVAHDTRRKVAASPLLLAACEAVVAWEREGTCGEDYPLTGFDVVLNQVVDALRAAGVDVDDENLNND